MALLSGKGLVWQVFAAGVVVSVSLAAQPAMAVDDLAVVEDIRPSVPPPMVDEAAPPPRYYAPPPHAQRPYAPEVYERDVYGPPPRLLPPYQITAVVRSSGYMPLGPVTRRGWVYTMAAAGPRGIEGRLVIDARTGRVVRFVPILADGDMAYGPPGPPLYQQDFRRAPRPPAPVPRVAKGNSTAPKVATQAPTAIEAPAESAPKAAATSAQHPPGGSPSADKPAAAASAPLDKTAEVKPAATVGTAAVPTAAPTASTLTLWPTQALPPVQPLD